MSDRYDGTYRALVIDNQDPLGERRVSVQIPELFPDLAMWARPSVPPGDITTLPTTGDVLWVEFEAGDPDRPVWQVEPSHVLPPSGHQGLAGVFRGVVVDNADPLAANRLLVQVPDVTSDTSLWATPDSGLSVSELPAIGTEVWIQYQSGDASYPVWVGVA